MRHPGGGTILQFLTAGSISECEPSVRNTVSSPSYFLINWSRYCWARTLFVGGPDCVCSDQLFRDYLLKLEHNRAEPIYHPRSYGYQMDDSSGTQTQPRIYTAPRTEISQNQGKFRIHFNFPGRVLPDHDDHGYGPLATVVESFMDPGTLIRMHQHRNEEIISWVPDGVMRHEDRQNNSLVTDRDHLMVMNAGSGFWHAEETYEDDPPLRMLQIFVRPHTLDLEPTIQHEPIPDSMPNTWRHLFGPDDSDAPLFVRNDVHFYDCQLDAGRTVRLPSHSDWDTYVYVFEGAVTADDGAVTLGYTESGLVTDEGEVSVTASEDSILVAFCVDPDAQITRQGTIGR